MTRMKEKNPHAQALGRQGGLARAKALTSDQRLEISRRANAVKTKRAYLRRILGGHDEQKNS